MAGTEVMPDAMIIEVIVEKHETTLIVEVAYGSIDSELRAELGDVNTDFLLLYNITKL